MEFKFEPGSTQAVFTWENLAHMSLLPDSVWSNQEIHIRRSGPGLAGESQLSLYNLDGSLVGNFRVNKDRTDIPMAEITREPLIWGRLYLLVLVENNHRITRKLIYQEP